MISRNDVLKRIRYSKRVQYDLPPPRTEVVTPVQRPENRIFRAIPPYRGGKFSPGITTESPGAGDPKMHLEEMKRMRDDLKKERESSSGEGLTPTQNWLIHGIKKTHGHADDEMTRNTVSKYLSQVDPHGVIDHLRDQFDYPGHIHIHDKLENIPESIMGNEEAVGKHRWHTVDTFISSLQNHEEDKGGFKKDMREELTRRQDARDNVMKSIGDYIDAKGIANHARSFINQELVKRRPLR